MIGGSPWGIMLRGTKEAQFLSREYILKQVDLQELEGEERGKKVRYMAEVHFQGGHCQCKERQGKARHQGDVRKAWNKHGQLVR